MSIPEPAPKPRGIVVPDALIRFLQSHKQDKLAKLVEQRDEFGRTKYGQPLMSDDGRNGVEDARQELGDLLQYVYKTALSNNPDDQIALVEFYETEICPAFEMIRELIKKP